MAFSSQRYEVHFSDVSLKPAVNEAANRYSNWMQTKALVKSIVAKMQWNLWGTAVNSILVSCSKAVL